MQNDEEHRYTSQYCLLSINRPRFKEDIDDDQDAFNQVLLSMLNVWLNNQLYTSNIFIETYL